ncbi:NADH:ubiquinone reductase (Na(+)-transporting) subunit D [Eisenibacter elegans]|jgi:Na+-transporting NADH:ubiquinone oxidoreductase subunit D|uniref:NADH:ubiquinone reductase (Na(+)-transporting) subunit D n=1 Tax=Eisenibacter elegans TaxID=997 RepID=UPI0004284152|nr:NADH:ubiquinone reductase (Na(+)-transporting) subunit D [Eisenibacter elegans]
MAEVAVKEVKKKEALFSKRNKTIFADPLSDNNPITVQVLGICSALAITAQMLPAVVMSLSVIFVMCCSSVLFSLISRTVPKSIRIMVQLAVIALFVILVDLFLKAYLYDVSKQLSTFVGLIITNCIVMGRLEAFAGNPENSAWSSFLDALGNALGYAIILIAIAFLRELFGAGSLFGYPVFNQVFALFGSEMTYEGNGLMLLPAGACVAVGVIIWIQRYWNGYAEAE